MDKKVTGIFEKEGDFGFINGEYLVIAGDEGDAKTGNKVEAVKVSDEPCSANYKITRVIDEIKNKVINGLEGVYKLHPNGKGGIVNNPNKKNNRDKDIFIPNRSSRGAKDGDVVEVVLSKSGYKPQGSVINIIQRKLEQSYSSREFLGKDFDIKNKKAILDIALEEGARIKFPDEVLKEAEGLNGDIDEAEIEKRHDLRDLFTITIDGADSKDLDDAISIEKLDNGKYKLYVHIADVTHYVKEWSPLDKEALQRGTSIYLVDKVIPMLPERLSNNLCSLNPNTDKLSMTCEMIIDGKGNIDTEKSKVYESVINSNFRTTYKEIEEIKNGDLREGRDLLFGGEINTDLLSLVKLGEIIADNLNRNTIKNGELEFDFDETKVEVDKRGEPIGFKPYPKYPSNDWIKAFMVAANRTVSKKYENKPFLHRTHLEPKEEAVEKLQNILSILGINFTIMFDPSSKNFSKLLKEIQGHEKQKFLEIAVLKTMQRANYTHERMGHFGLAQGFYSHFTSPIRRYPDLQIHRIIKEIINGKFDEKKANHFDNILEEVAYKSSSQEDKGEDIERKVNKHMSVRYMKNKIGQEFSGYISDILENRVFVQLENTISGTVIIEEKDFIFDEILKGQLYKLIGKDGKCLNVGDNVNLQLESVDEIKLSINFNIIK